MPAPYAAQQFADNSAVVDFWLPEPSNFLRLICRHVAADVQPGALITAHLSFDGSNFNTDPIYMNTGWSYWPAEPNPAFSQQPYPIGFPQTLDLGCRLGIDAGERPELALDCNVDFTALGSLNGQNVSPKYLCSGAIGFIGGAAGVSPRPEHLGGGVWFPDDPQGQPFDWSAQFAFGGHVAAPGQRIHGIRLSMDGGGSFGRLIKQGYFRLETVADAENIGPTPGVTFTAIGDYHSMAFALDGQTSKPSTDGAWKVDTSGWIGKTGDIPWSASQFRVFGANDAGLVLSTPANVTVTLFESDAVPTGPTDGVVVEQKVLADSDIGAPVTFNLPSGEKLSRWVIIDHGNPSTSMYVAAIV